MTNQNPYGSAGQNPEGQGFEQNPGGQPQGQNSDPNYSQPADVQNNAGQWQTNGAAAGADNGQGGAAGFVNNVKARPMNQLVVGAGIVAALLFLLFYTLTWRTFAMSFFGSTIEGHMNGWGASELDGTGFGAGANSSDLDAVQLVIALISFGLLAAASVMFYLHKEKFIACAMAIGSSVLGLLLLVLSAVNSNGSSDDIEELESLGGSVDFGYGAGFWLALLLHLAVTAGAVWLFMSQRALLMEGSKVTFGMNRQGQMNQQAFGAQAPGQQHYGQQGFGAPAQGQQGYGSHKVSRTSASRARIHRTLAISTVRSRHRRATASQIRQASKVQRISRLRLRSHSGRRATVRSHSGRRATVSSRRTRIQMRTPRRATTLTSSRNLVCGQPLAELC